MSVPRSFDIFDLGRWIAFFFDKKFGQKNLFFDFYFSIFVEICSQNRNWHTVLSCKVRPLVLEIRPCAGLHRRSFGEVSRVALHKENRPHGSSEISPRHTLPRPVGSRAALARLVDGGRWTRRNYTLLDTSITLLRCDTVPHTAIKSAVRSRNLYYPLEVWVRSISAYYGVFLPAKYPDSF